MVWRATDPQGNESAKVRFDLVPYMSGRVLDLGCGPQKVFPTAIGIDNRIDAQLFGIQVKPDIPVQDCLNMPFLADQCADTVFSSHLLEHIVDTGAALREWWRLVKVGGYLVLYLPHKKFYPNIGQPGANPDHKHDFEPADIVDYMREVAEKAVQGWTLEVNESRNGGTEYSFLQVYRKTQGAACSEPAPASKPEKTLAVVRLGANGDALWMSSLLPHWKREGWHITVYTQAAGELMLRHDPNIDRIICQPQGLFDFGDGTTSMLQTAYWLHEAKKYDRFINLIGAVERRLLPQPFDPDFYLPLEQRQRVMNRNYLEALHEWAGVPFDRTTVRQKFYPTADEMAWAAEERAKVDGPLVLINPAGSSAPKFWPYAHELMNMLAAEGLHSIIVGDLRGVPFKPAGRHGRVIGQSWPLRKLLALAALADVVVGTESVLVNAVAHEPPMKIVLLSHSTHENLTRDWRNTIAVMPDHLPCYPCHRIHADFTHCNLDRSENAAACQSAAKPDLVMDYIVQFLNSKVSA
jgi:ADP-heptose:LPS heptosyltransferase/predicted SAM-dependent methyltransferase